MELDSSLDLYQAVSKVEKNEEQMRASIITRQETDGGYIYRLGVPVSQEVLIDHLIKLADRQYVDLGPTEIIKEAYEAGDVVTIKPDRLVFQSDHNALVLSKVQVVSKENDGPDDARALIDKARKAGIYEKIKKSEEYRYILMYHSYKLPAFRGWWSDIKINVKSKGQTGFEWGGYFVPEE